MRVLPRVEFGNPLLRKKAQHLSLTEVASPKIQGLIKNMRHTLTSKKLGVGLAAPQVGQVIAVSVIAIHPTKHRSKVESLDLVIINPQITKTFGYRKQLWEGCLSAGESGLFAKVARYTKVELSYTDEQGTSHIEQFTDLAAQVIQHEVDHLNGILFIDHVKDPSTYMTLREYKKQVVSSRKKQ